MSDASSHDALCGSSIGNYRIGVRLGRGGMSTVYVATDERSGRPAALKVLHHELASDPKYLERFQREAHALSALTHPNVVQILDVVVLPDGRPGIVQELLGGPSLADWLAVHGPVGVRDVAELLGPVCRAASIFHEAGIVHRDLKPENLVFPDAGAAPSSLKIVDFGVARMTEGQASKLTGKNILGTPEYVAPEIIEGNTADARADVYAIGVIAYQMLTATTPFKGPTVGAILLQHLSRNPAPPSSHRADLSPAVDAVVLRAIAKSPADRFATALDMAAALADLAAAEG